MQKMLIAVDSEIISEELIKAFHMQYTVYSCTQGSDALRLLQEVCPEILIISLSPPGISGLSVLQQTTYTPPAILALTTYVSDDIVQKAEASGVGALIRLPCSIKHIETKINALVSYCFQI